MSRFSHSQQLVAVSWFEYMYVVFAEGLATWALRYNYLSLGKENEPQG